MALVPFLFIHPHNLDLLDFYYPCLSQIQKLQVEHSFRFFLKQGPWPWHTKPLWVPLIPKQCLTCWVLLLKRNISSSDTDLDTCCAFGKTWKRTHTKHLYTHCQPAWFLQATQVTGGTSETAGLQKPGSLGSAELQERASFSKLSAYRLTLIGTKSSISFFFFFLSPIPFSDISTELTA